MPETVESPTSYYRPWEKTFGRILTPFEEFIHRETALGVVLIFCALAALVIANSPLSAAYERLLDTHIVLSIGSYTVNYTLHHWINDGMMAFFFFVVGLEIKREILDGDLSNIRAASLPLIAALGGMVVPALIYYGLNSGTEASEGWGIPMATDIAFAVGVLALLGNRIPKSLFTFLVALAIVDDLGAVAVIAIFYTEQIMIGPLGLAGACLAVLIVFNLAGLRNPVPYFVVAIFLWFAMMESGVHATIAGILGAMTVPIRPKYEPAQFSQHIRALLDRFDELDSGDKSLVHNARQRAIVQAVESGIHKVESPLHRLEHIVHTPVAFFVIPVFALANAGIPIEFATLGQTLVQPVSLGIGLGLVVGKLIGAGGFALIAARLGLGQMPEGCRSIHMIGIALLAGIGFTMSIFIAELAFRDDLPQYLLQAKTGILLASLVAGLCGYLLLRHAGAPTEKQK